MFEFCDPTENTSNRNLRTVFPLTEAYGARNKNPAIIPCKSKKVFLAPPPLMNNTVLPKSYNLSLPVAVKPIRYFVSRFQIILKNFTSICCGYILRKYRYYQQNGLRISFIARTPSSCSVDNPIVRYFACQ